MLFFGLQTVAVLELASGLAAVLIHLQPSLGAALTWAVGTLLLERGQERVDP